MEPTAKKQWTIPEFSRCKAPKRRLAVLTAYDYPTARIFDEAGVDALLVGDTLGMVVQGHSNTLKVTVEQMLYHTEMVARACKQALVIADLPFLSYQIGESEAIANAGRMLKEAGAHAVKLEGGRRSAATIQAITDSHIPVMGHVGLTPQSIHKLGAYRVQRDFQALMDDARAVEDAGAFAIVLEAMPAGYAEKITQALQIPTIGIGAGPHCDGQVLVANDALGLTQDFLPRFVKQFANLHQQIDQAARQFCEEVRNGTFPEAKHSYE
jgi:3-methyl-2-oxobutanoate hydroxymethyltransferase